MARSLSSFLLLFSILIFSSISFAEVEPHEVEDVAVARPSGDSFKKALEFVSEKWKNASRPMTAKNVAIAFGGHVNKPDR
jgi:hypothetical protein